MRITNIDGESLVFVDDVEARSMIRSLNNILQNWQLYNECFPSPPEFGLDSIPDLLEILDNRITNVVEEYGDSDLAEFEGGALMSYDMYQILNRALEYENYGIQCIDQRLPDFPGMEHFILTQGYMPLEDAEVTQGGLSGTAKFLIGAGVGAAGAYLIAKRIK